MERTTCQVENTDDKKIMTITTEWLDENIKITILQPGITPLTGQTTVTQLREYLRNEMPREQFVADLKKELSGKEKETHFTLKESKLVWKKKIWRKGMIELKPIVDVVALSDISLEWLNEYANLQETNSRQREEDETQIRKIEELSRTIKDMEAAKKSMEDMLYKQFLFVLNTKKRKIKELEEELKNVKIHDSIYDEETDKSNDESGESSNPPRKIRKKSQVLSSNKSDASTSRISRTVIKSSPESEDEIELKFIDSQDVDKKLNMEEDPEPDLFSQ